MLQVVPNDSQFFCNLVVVCPEYNMRTMEDVSGDTDRALGPITGTQLLFNNCFYFSFSAIQDTQSGRYIFTETLFKLNQIKFLSEEINLLNVTSFHLNIPLLYVLKALMPGVLCLKSVL